METESEIQTIPKLRRVIYSTFALFPTTGLREGDLAYATDQVALYRWNGTAWQLIAGQVTTKIKCHTRVMSDASGDVAYTAYGFQPRGIVVFAIHDSSSVEEWSHGTADTLGDDECVFRRGNIFDGGAWLILIQNVGATDFQYAILKSFDADGFTLTWTKGGTPTDNIDFIVTAFR